MAEIFLGVAVVFLGYISWRLVDIGIELTRIRTMLASLHFLVGEKLDSDFEYVDPDAEV